ncbi:hypothetical protein ACIBBE_43445 [Streptomyces sp. NPDC051644]|uniref:hypothetical protein n=1 Tax=Streptomyces sp. NPDC051644 TaxID=3365666 RepID=UPI0037B2EFBC
MTTTILTRPTNGGGYGGMEDDDNQRGYERDETDQFHQVVGQLVATGDHRARTAGRRARRTLAEMAPGYERQPVLLLTCPLPVRAANDACGICGYWTCRCGNGFVALAATPRTKAVA